ncbi:MAG: ribulose-phosphate 3-epimerase [Candidatus Dormibacteria bacterium]
MSLLAPSILAADLAHLADELKACEEGGADRIHVDIMDGHFVPNLTMGPDLVAACRRSTALFLEAHLMIERPDQMVPQFCQAGAQLVTVHFEACPQLHRTLAHVRQEGVKVGVGINPATPVAFLEEVLPEIDLALVMSVDPGFGGQTFLGSSLAKVSRLHQLVEERRLDCEIEVDGGVGPDNVVACVGAGASVLVAGTAIFKSEGGARRGLGCLRELVAQAKVGLS